MKRQIEGQQINGFLRKRKSDPATTKFVMELTDGTANHRTCLDAELRVVKDEILDCPSKEACWEQDMRRDDFLFDLEA